ncbi:MAG: oxidoreductase [Candidatus Sericytochromatia bacterium]|nr:MAG: oxidoreductase [Candidatus Sericytochromatia bacterium]
MRAIVFEKPCEASDLKIKNWKKPKVSNDNVLINVKCFGLNFADIMARKGLYKDAPPMPFVCGYEVSGIIEELGENVRTLKKGDKVLALVEFGGYAEYALTKEKACFKLPDNMTFAQGASIPVNFLTAYHSIYGTGYVNENDFILIHAVAGGVGLAALQLSKIQNLKTIGTASSRKKLELAKNYGLDYGIDYIVYDFEKEVNRITDKKGVEIILDSIGGNNIKKGINILKTGGRIVCFGVSSLSERRFSKLPFMLKDIIPMFALNIIPLLLNSKGIYGVNMLHLARDRQDLIVSYMNKILKLFSENRLKTIISEEFSWTEISKAHKLMEERKTTGKIILHID